MSEGNKDNANKKSAVVSIIGCPNVGKSTLLNSILGQKISIVTPKAQTTRNIINGITVIEDTQIVFLDTPGIFEAKRSVDKFIVKQAWSSIKGSDFVVFMIDATKDVSKQVSIILDRLLNQDVRLVVAINKIDVKKNKLLEVLKYLIEKNIKYIFQISAYTGKGVDHLLNYLRDNAMQREWFYEKDQITTIPLRFLSSEITREKVFFDLDQEIPYNTIVETEDIKYLEDESIKISQVIYVTTNGHKKIVLGKSGQKIKYISMRSRQELEKIYERKFHLYLFVKVKENLLDDASIFNRNLCY